MEDKGRVRYLSKNLGRGDNSKLWIIVLKGRSSHPQSSLRFHPSPQSVTLRQHRETLSCWHLDVNQGIGSVEVDYQTGKDEIW